MYFLFNSKLNSQKLGFNTPLAPEPTQWYDQGLLEGVQKEHLTRARAQGARKQIPETPLLKRCETAQCILLTPDEDLFWNISYPQTRFLSETLNMTTDKALL